MLSRVKYFWWLFKQREMLVTVLEQATRKEAYQSNFSKLFGYYPLGLEYNDVSIIKMTSSSRIGNDNKLIIAKTQYPCGNNESRISLGKNCWTGRNVEINILTGTQVIIKDYSTIQDNCKLIGDIVVEKYCLFAPLVFISSGNHYALKGKPDIIRNQDEEHLGNEELLIRHSQKVHIEEDCWLGYSAFVKQGVYIGRGAVIGAHAVVTKNVLPYSVVGGSNNVLNTRFDFIPPAKIEAGIAEHAPYFYRGFMHKNNECETVVESDLKVLDNDTCIFILKHGNLDLLHIEGKVLNQKIAEPIEISIVCNEVNKALAIVPVSVDGSFELLIRSDDFIALEEKTNDPVFSLSGKFNVFRLTYNFNTTKQQSNTVAIKYIKETFYDRLS